MICRVAHKLLFVLHVTDVERQKGKMQRTASIDILYSEITFINRRFILPNLYIYHKMFVSVPTDFLLNILLFLVYIY
jgi:hypothetical protein